MALCSLSTGTYSQSISPASIRADISSMTWVCGVMG